MRDELTDDLLHELRRYPEEIIAGIDEVGRGCWAGPVVAAAVVLPPGVTIPGARDSKLLSPSTRDELSVFIKQVALGIGVGWASHAEIDRYGLTRAVALSGRRALKALGQPRCPVVLDGNHNYLKRYCRAKAIVKADNRVLSVACASIIAKVARDRYMRYQHRLYPEYGFETNVGYGTPSHRRAVEKSLSPIHRRLFKPVMAAQQTQAAFMEMITSVH
jgi:ribonuclease HII